MPYALALNAPSAGRRRVCAPLRIPRRVLGTVRPERPAIGLRRAAARPLTSGLPTARCPSSTPCDTRDGWPSRIACSSAQASRLPQADSESRARRVAHPWALMGLECITPLFPARWGNTGSGQTVRAGLHALERACMCPASHRWRDETRLGSSHCPSAWASRLPLAD